MHVQDTQYPDRKSLWVWFGCWTALTNFERCASALSAAVSSSALHFAAETVFVQGLGKCEGTFIFS